MKKQKCCGFFMNNAVYFLAQWILFNHKKTGYSAMRKVFNFNAGPAMLPEEVLLEAQAELLDWHDTGISVMEMGHRGTNFTSIAEKAEADLREVMNIPSHYNVFFVAGGATTQFAMVPLNLFGENTTADYLDTGIWSKKAIAEANRYGKVNIATQTMQDNHLAYVPAQSEWKLNENAAYVHYTPNETIDGIEFPFTPQTGKVPLVADMTSTILSRPIDVNEYGIIYAGAQKNLGPAGITVVIVRGDLVKEALPSTPTLYKYKVYAENNSFYNTPPTFSWYVTGLVIDWVKKQGGLTEMYARNQEKSQLIYNVINEHKDFYLCRVRPDCRSLTNVMFYLHDENLTPEFLDAAAKENMVNLRGHRVSGGVRASMYNPFPVQGAKVLAEFMLDFVKRKG